jgi:hypothetical protein
MNAAIKNERSDLDETIAWRSVADCLPDVDTTVLLYVPELNEPVWPGALDGEVWIVDGFECAPTHWAPMPVGPFG